MMVALREPKVAKPIPRKIPQQFIYEILDGRPIYYKGYQEVIENKKTIEEIMGASGIQSFIISYLTKWLFSFLDDDKFCLLSNEAGLHLNHRSNLSNDIAIYETSVLTPDKINRKYVDVPPKIAIEIDIDGDVEHLTEAGYIYKKTQKMLAFGTKKVVWVLTAAQVVIVATDEKIESFNWYKDIELMPGQSFNIGQYLDKKGIVVE
jgi:Uma2 family endonuclease